MAAVTLEAHEIGEVSRDGVTWQQIFEMTLSAGH
jgi:hypothetical protein